VSSRFIYAMRLNTLTELPRSYHKSFSSFAAGCGVKPAVYSRVSSVIPWIERTVCQLTSNPAALPFRCPDLACPIETALFGSPLAVLPRVSGIDGFRVLNGFPVAKLRQLPRAGTPLLANTTRVVKVMAISPKKATRYCQWTVTVPPVAPMASVQFNVSRATSRQVILVPFPPDVSGFVYRIRATVINGTRPLHGGSQARLLASLRPDPFGDSAGPPPAAAFPRTMVALGTKETRRSLALPFPVPIASTCLIAVRAVKVTNLANVSIELRLYGQQHAAH
jgi:hypothetical protein